MGPTGWTAWRRVASGSSPVRPAPSRPEPPCPAGPHLGLPAGVIPLAGNRSPRVTGWPRFCGHPGAGGNPTVRPFQRQAHPGSSPASAAPPDRSRSLCPPRPPARHRRGPVVSGEKDRAGRAAVSRTPETAPPDARRRLPVIVLQAGLRAFGSAGDGFTRRHRRACRIRAKRAAMRNGDFAIPAHAGIRLRRAMAPYRPRLNAAHARNRTPTSAPRQRMTRPLAGGKVILHPVKLCDVTRSSTGKRIPNGASSNLPGQARPCAGTKPPAAGPGRPGCASSRLLPAQAQSRQAPCRLAILRAVIPVQTRTRTAAGLAPGCVRRLPKSVSMSVEDPPPALAASGAAFATSLRRELPPLPHPSGSSVLWRSWKRNSAAPGEAHRRGKLADGHVDVLPARMAKWRPTRRGRPTTLPRQRTTRPAEPPHSQ